MSVTAKERILMIKLLEKQQRRPDYAKRIGIQVRMVVNDPKKTEEKHA